MKSFQETIDDILIDLRPYDVHNQSYTAAGISSIVGMNTFCYENRLEELSGSFPLKWSWIRRKLLRDTRSRNLNNFRCILYVTWT